jgi:hypothetical protein
LDRYLDVAGVTSTLNPVRFDLERALKKNVDMSEVMKLALGDCLLLSKRDKEHYNDDYSYDKLDWRRELTTQLIDYIVKPSVMVTDSKQKEAVTTEGNCDPTAMSLGVKNERADHHNHAAANTNADADADADAPLFEVDTDTQETFFSSPQKVAVASARLRDIRFVDKVKWAITGVAFELPQESKSMSTTFCNEMVYGHVNVLMVAGVVRLAWGGL